MTLTDDLDLGTSRCILMRCAFIPNMSLVTKLVSEQWENVKFHVKFVQTDRWTDRRTMVKQSAQDLSIPGHKKLTLY